MKHITVIYIHGTEGGEKRVRAPKAESLVLHLLKQGPCTAAIVAKRSLIWSTKPGTTDAPLSLASCSTLLRRLVERGLVKSEDKYFVLPGLEEEEPIKRVVFTTNVTVR